MPTLVEKIALAREKRDAADESFRRSLEAGREAGMSWNELAVAAGLSRYGVRYLTANLNRRRQQTKGENGE